MTVYSALKAQLRDNCRRTAIYEEVLIKGTTSEIVLITRYLKTFSYDGKVLLGRLVCMLRNKCRHIRHLGVLFNVTP